MEATVTTGNAPERILAIIPAYNEEASVGAVVRELTNQAPFLDILVVDDGSLDNTVKEAGAAGATVLSIPTNLGIGCAMKAGMSFALERGYDMALQVDGDGQHDPSQVHRLLEPLRSSEVDVAIGSRFLGTGGYKPPWHRRLGTLLLSAMVRAATGSKATDTTSGFRAMNRRALQFLAENYPEDYPESESLVLMHMAGIRWKEVPVMMRSRSGGTSSIRSLSSVYYMIKVMFCILLDASHVKSPRPVVQGGEQR